jgi:hypothetical protein
MSDNFTDPFDSLLNQLATVMVRDVSGADGYGQANPTFSTIATGVPCAVDIDKVPSDKEFLAKSKEAIEYKMVFMRPWFDGSGNPLSHDHWLQITVNGNTNMYDIFQIHDPGGLGHHLEVECRLLIA